MPLEGMFYISKSLIIVGSWNGRKVEARKGNFVRCATKTASLPVISLLLSSSSLPLAHPNVKYTTEEHTDRAANAYKKKSSL